MPEYLAPGVYVEEVSFRSKTIEGVGTSTSAFVGPTLKGPVGGTPELLTSFADFERIYGGVEDFAFGSDPILNRNYVGHAVRSYFNNGGARLYVMRAFTPDAGDGIADAFDDPVLFSQDSSTPPVITENAWFAARFPGSAANRARVLVQQTVAPIGGKSLRNAADGTLVRVHSGRDWRKDGTTWKLVNANGSLGADVASGAVSDTGKNVWLLEEMPDGGSEPEAVTPSKLTNTQFNALDDDAKVRVFDPVEMWLREDGEWTRLTRGGTAVSSTQTAVSDADLDAVQHAFAVGIDVEYQPSTGAVLRWQNRSPVKDHPRDIRLALAQNPSKRSDALTQPIALMFADGFSTTPIELLTGLVGAQPAATRFDADYDEPSEDFFLLGGDDGTLPSVQGYADGLDLLVGLEDVSVVACPGYSARAASDYQGIQDALLTHVGNPRRYRIGVLDAPPDQTPSTMRSLRGLIDSTRAALYYPWVVVNNPLAGPNSPQPAEIALPPSGFVCGIYARNDIERGVWKAPANEVVRGALRFERHVNHGEQELLNPIGVNCLRYLSGRGFRVWGARTVTSDPEWKYVNVRRYFNYLESSIDRGTQWVVFEPNGEMLWANVRGTVSDFLLNEWKSGALLGTKQDEAFFVRCDRTTMTQNDLDNGRLICLIGIAVVKPAEFVIFRIGQKTADAKS